MPITRRKLPALLLMLCSVTISLPTSANELPAHRVSNIEFNGAKRTDKAWLSTFLKVDLPQELTKTDISRLLVKLQNTALFKEIDYELRRNPDNDGYTLVFHLEEKWTTIPVVRGVFGGGTPLRVVGAYDINLLGQNKVLGGEFRKYGDAPTGGVAYYRDPHALSGKAFIGAEVWQNHRIRDFYSEENHHYGSAQLNTKELKLRFLQQNSGTTLLDGSLKYGLELKHMMSAKAQFTPSAGDDAPAEVQFGDSYTSQLNLLPTIQYDNIKLSNLNLHGVRSIAKAGLMKRDKNRSLMEFEFFGYNLFSPNTNAAFHLFYGQHQSQEVENLYYLGGFDSIRGLPDGALIGRRAVYANVELRHTLKTWKYLWLQPTVFSDAGNAKMQGPLFDGNHRSSSGVGIRLSIPQIHRMVFRFDYAWSTDGSNTQGLNIGMNQFFQPYRPL